MNRLNGTHFGEPNGNERTSAGKFAPGNPGGPGRPRRSTEREYLAALTEEVPAETWRHIIRRAVADAVAGDRHARDWISRYLLGNPAELPTLGALAEEEPEA